MYILKLIKGGFSLEEDVELIFNNIETDLSQYKKLGDDNEYDKNAYIILSILNILIKLYNDEKKKTRFESISEKYIPQFLVKAKNIFDNINLEDKEISLDQYIKIKKFIDDKLNLNNEFNWLKEGEIKSDS